MIQIVFEKIPEDPSLSECATVAAEAALTALNKENWLASVVFTDDQEVSRLNEQFRQIEGPTDVLSFPAKMQDPEAELPYLGDVIISTEYARRQAEAHKNTFIHEIELLVVHGLLHLCGYDHYTEEEKSRMWKTQQTILNHVQNPLRPE